MALAPLTGRWQARRWAGNTGMVLDDVRGPMVITGLKNNAVFRRAGGAIGTMVAFLVTFGPKYDDSFATFTAACGLVLGGYGLGVVAAHAFRRPRVSSLLRASLYSDADLRERRYQPAIGGSERIGAFVVVGTGMVSSIAFLIHPNGDERWPALITLVLLPTSLVALGWVERQRLWGSTEADVDVMASMRTGDIRVLWAICSFFGAVATVSGVADMFQLDSWWSIFSMLMMPFAFALVVLAASGGRMSSNGRNSPPALWLPGDSSQTRE